jgi:hypothetical protein
MWALKLVDEGGLQVSGRLKVGSRIQSPPNTP